MVCVVIYLSEQQSNVFREGRPHGVAPTLNGNDNNNKMENGIKGFCAFSQNDIVTTTTKTPNLQSKFCPF
jgi:hypothetical protein